MKTDVYLWSEAAGVIAMRAVDYESQLIVEGFHDPALGNPSHFSEVRHVEIQVRGLTDADRSRIVATMKDRSVSIFMLWTMQHGVFDEHGACLIVRLGSDVLDLTSSGVFHCRKTT